MNKESRDQITKEMKKLKEKGLSNRDIAIIYNIPLSSVIKRLK